MSKMEEYIRLVENTLARQDILEDPKELYEPISYILGLGGKRLRPAMALAACDLVGGDVRDAMMPALGVEVFHNFTLLHDDLMDKSEVRRGKKTVHKRWNANTAILSGDAMLVKAYEYVAQVDPTVLPNVLKVFTKTALEVCEGQQYDLNFETREGVTEEDYLEMIRLKTSVLLGAAMKIGALIGGTKIANADRLYRFGENIGVAFQIQDDILDSFGDEEKFGKAIGGDILNDKKTILWIYTAHHGGDDITAVMQKNFSSDSEKIQVISKLMLETGARKYAEEKMDAYYREALAALNEVEGNSALKLELATFAEWLIKREK